MRHHGEFKRVGCTRLRSCLQLSVDRDALTCLPNLPPLGLPWVGGDSLCFHTACDLPEGGNEGKVLPSPSSMEIPTSQTAPRRQGIQKSQSLNHWVEYTLRTKSSWCLLFWFAGIVWCSVLIVHFPQMAGFPVEHRWIGRSPQRHRLELIMLVVPSLTELLHTLAMLWVEPSIIVWDVIPVYRIGANCCSHNGWNTSWKDRSQV